ncbi:hypothetical protein IWZ00DRAFT_312680 [Phyllosticta capitalensis]
MDHVRGGGVRVARQLSGLSSRVIDGVYVSGTRTSGVERACVRPIWRGSPGAPGTAGPPRATPFEELDKSRQWASKWSVLKLKQRRRETVGCGPRITATFSIGRTKACGERTEATSDNPPMFPGSARPDAASYARAAHVIVDPLNTTAAHFVPLCTCTDQGRRRVPNLTSFQAKIVILTAMTTSADPASLVHRLAPWPPAEATP